MSSTARVVDAVVLARLYFAAQALAGVGWWVAVFAFPLVRTATLGDLDPPTVAVLDVPLFVVASGAAAVLPRRARLVASGIATGWTLAVTAGLAVYATVTGAAGWGVLAMTAASICSVAAFLLLATGRIPTSWILIGPFAFRNAPRRRSAAPHVAATALQILVFWGLFLGVFPLAIAALEQRWRLALAFPPGALPAGLVLFAAAGALGLWSAGALTLKGDGTPLPSAMPNRLVVAGPYRWVRNPMAIAGIVQGFAVGVAMSSWLVLIYAIAGSAVWNYAVRPHEEADLAEKFGDDFDRYRAAVRCWVPRLGPGFR